MWQQFPDLRARLPKIHVLTTLFGQQNDLIKFIDKGQYGIFAMLQWQQLIRPNRIPTFICLLGLQTVLNRLRR